MSTSLQEAEKLLAQMTTLEKAQLLMTVARELSNGFPGLEWDSQVCGDNPCIMRTRIPVWLIEQARRLGMNESQILRSYPNLRHSDLVNAWAYAQTHPEEINRQIQENDV